MHINALGHRTLARRQPCSRIGTVQHGCGGQTHFRQQPCKAHAHASGSAAPAPTAGCEAAGASQAQGTASGSHATRRQYLAAAAAAAALGLQAGRAQAAEGEAAASAEPDLTITDTIYLDIGVADSAFKAPGERTLGDRTVIPEPKVMLGRIEIGLYGNLAPVTARNLLTAVRSGALTGTVVSRISLGEYIQIGRQGSRRLGEVEIMSGLLPNSDISSPGGFKLSHSRPGTVSLSISADNDEDPVVKDRSSYRPLEFMITTGPGPVPRLDGLNPVFGRVTGGMATVAAVASVPSFQPDIRSQQLNAFAKFIGDDRADKVRRRYGRPLKAVIITSAGVVGEEPAAAAPARAQQEQQQQQQQQQQLRASIRAAAEESEAALDLV